VSGSLICNVDAEAIVELAQQYKLIYQSYLRETNARIALQGRSTCGFETTVESFNNVAILPHALNGL
jgi:hypothetical protein